MRTKATEINNILSCLPICIDHPFILLNERPFFRLLFYLKSSFGYTLNPGLAVSTDPNNSAHVHQKHFVPKYMHIYMGKKGFKLGIKMI